MSLFGDEKQLRKESSDEKETVQVPKLNLDLVAEKLGNLINTNQVDISTENRGYDPKSGLYLVEARATRFKEGGETASKQEIIKTVKVSTQDFTFEGAQLKSLELVQKLLGDL